MYIFIFFFGRFTPAVKHWFSDCCIKDHQNHRPAQVQVYIYIYIYIYIYVYICVCIYVCVNIYIYRQ